MSSNNDSNSNSDGKGHHVANFHFKAPPNYTGHDMTEPLDLSKLKIGNMDPVHIVFDDNEPDTAEEEDEEMNEEEEDRFTRGRSRSRSVHSNDDDGNSYAYGGHGHPVPPVYHPDEANSSSGDTNSTDQDSADSSITNGGENGADGTGKNHAAVAVERTGPLQHREVAALQKGLEEAQQSLSKNAREDEEERMAADAEKRKRLLAANHQVSSSNNEPFKRFKLLLLGDSAVGKSSLILRWTMDTFSANLTSTVGVNFKSKKVQCFGEWIQVQVWDTSGQENFHKITTSYYRGAQGIMLVYDVTEKKSLDNVAYWIKNIKAHASENVQIVLVGNKIDLRDGSSQNSVVTTEMGRQVAQKFGVPFFETSAKAASHVEDAFMTLVAAIAQTTAASQLPLIKHGSNGSSSNPSSPMPSSGSNNNSPIMATHNHHNNTNVNNANGISPSSSPDSSNNNNNGNNTTKRGFFSALRRRSSGGGNNNNNNSNGGENHQNEEQNGLHLEKDDTHNTSNNNSVEGQHQHGAEGDKEKCVIS